MDIFYTEALLEFERKNFAHAEEKLIDALVVGIKNYNSGHLKLLPIYHLQVRIEEIIRVNLIFE